MPLWSLSCSVRKYTRSVTGTSGGRTESNRRRFSQSAPVFGHDNTVFRVMGVVPDRRGEAQPALIDIYEISDLGHVLRAVVNHSGNFVAIQNELHASGP